MERPTHDQDGNFIYYASELGSCTKALIAKRMGYIPKLKPVPVGEEDRLQLLFDEGNLHEQAIIDKLIGEGASLRDFQKELKLAVGVPGTIIMGHIDARGYGPKYWRGDRVVEIKSMGDDAYKDFIKHGWSAGGFIPRYKWQISLYCWASELPGVLVAKNRNNGQITCLEVPQGGFYTYDDFQLRLLEVETAAELGELPEKCDKPIFPCPYEYLHIEDIEIRKDGEVDIWARIYKLAQQDAKEAEARAKEAREHLEGALGSNTKLETLNGTRITRYTVKGKPAIDARKVEAYLGGITDKAWREFMREQLSSERGGYSALRVTVQGYDDKGGEE